MLTLVNALIFIKKLDDAEVAAGKMQTIGIILANLYHNQLL
uniref:Uncharacterized protein n=1 Tax=Anguilla anguilla TaxID=7936 RepID=A0A0E9UYQ7_ANGAN